MNYATALSLIQAEIIANGNNEITANVLRPVLEAMIDFPNDVIGVLADLDTSDTTSIVNAINSIVSQNLPNRTVLFPIDTTGIDFNQDELLWVRDAINQTATNNGAFTCNLGEQMVFFCDVLIDIVGTEANIQRRYYRLTTGATLVNSLGTTLTPPLMPDGSSFNTIELTGDLVIDLGDIGTDDVEDAFNSDASQPFTINGDKFVQAIQNGNNKLWQWIGGDGTFGNSATLATSTDFVDLTSNATPPIDYSPFTQFKVLNVDTSAATSVIEGFVYVQYSGAEIISILFPISFSKYLSDMINLDSTVDFGVGIYNKVQGRYLAEAAISFSVVNTDYVKINLSTGSIGFGEIANGDLLDFRFSFYKTGGAVDFVSNVETDTILGRITAGTGNSEELTPTQVRTLINVEDGAEVNDVDSVNGQTGAVVLDEHDIVGTRISESVATTKNIDLDTVSDFHYTMTADTAFTFTNTPTGNEVKRCKIRLTGEFAPSWTQAGLNSFGDAYDGTKWNDVLVEMWLDGTIKGLLIFQQRETA